MEILFELSKEHPTLPIGEIKACLKTYGIEYEEIYHNDFFIIKTNRSLENIAKRLAMTFSINEILGHDENFIKNLEIKGTFKIEGGNLLLRKKIGEKIVKEKGSKVNLKNPDTKIKIFIDGKTYFCKELFKIDRKQFEKRRGSKRPFSLPTTMHPRIARVLVNLARLKENDIMLDPFCGTGGILIEAGSIGIRTIGIDIKENAIKGCKKNMEYYGIKNYKLYNADMKDLDFSNIDGIVTDFPYGRASYICDAKKLYGEAFEKIHKWLKKGGIAVVGLPSLAYRNLAKKYFEILEIHCARVHKSLIRYFYVMKKAI